MPRILTPSILCFGNLPLTISATVGSISIEAARLLDIVDFFITLGQEIIVGTLCPPSKTVPFPSLKPAVFPAWFPKFNHGPLSLVKIIIVFSSILFSSRALTIYPNDQSSSIITSPYNP